MAREKKMTCLMLAILIVSITFSHAQYNSPQNKVWAFGHKAGLDFNSGSPVPITTALPDVYTEGVASASDTAGQLLFYTDGKKVYNRHHALMPSGNSIVPFMTISSTQGALIVPVIGVTGRYYIFALESVSFDPTHSHLAYSVVDMSLDGGNGDVVSSSMGTMIQDSLSEKMIAITGNDHNIWVIVHQQDTAIFLAYNVSASGIDTIPVRSAVGRLSDDSGAYASGVLKVSPNRRRIVCQTIWLPYNNPSGTELFDFDPATGLVSNCIALDSLNSQYGAEFSPDNTKLYVRELNKAGDTAKIFQYNLSLGAANAIRSSKTLLYNSRSRISDLKLAPDNKIYTAGRDDSFSANIYSRFLDCIVSPNAPGTLCNYTEHAVMFTVGTGICAGLPNLYVTEDTVATASVNGTALQSVFSFFPNPVYTNLTIISRSILRSARVYDLFGREVCSVACSGHSAAIEVSKMPPGLYSVVTISDNGTGTGTFVKQ
jgi:hypothetical protein